MGDNSLESFETAFTLALGTALLGLGSCTNAQVFAQDMTYQPTPVVKKCVHRDLPVFWVYQYTNTVHSLIKE